MAICTSRNENETEAKWELFLQYLAKFCKDLIPLFSNYAPEVWIQIIVVIYTKIKTKVITQVGLLIAEDR